jgi:hypothetical protein
MPTVSCPSPPCTWVTTLSPPLLPSPFTSILYKLLHYLVPLPTHFPYFSASFTLPLPFLLSPDSIKAFISETGTTLPCGPGDIRGKDLRAPKKALLELDPKCPTPALEIHPQRLAVGIKALSHVTVICPVWTLKVKSSEEEECELSF